MSKRSRVDQHNFLGVFADVASLPDASVSSEGVEAGDFAYCVDGDVFYKCTNAAANLWTVMGSDVVWEWNGVDTSQFATSNVLPAPAVPGTTTGASLTAVASSVAPGGVALEVGLTSMSGPGAAIWWIDQPLPLQNMRVEMSFSYPNPGPLPSSGEAAYVGFVFAGDSTLNSVIADTYWFEDDGAGNIIYSHKVYQYESSGPTFVLLTDDVMPTGSYFLFAETRVQADRGDVVYAGGSGVPRGSIDSVVSGFLPPPTATLSLPHGSAAMLNSTLFPPGTAWSTSSCNRIGIVIGGSTTTPFTSQIIRLRFLRD